MIIVAIGLIVSPFVLMMLGFAAMSWREGDWPTAVGICAVPVLGLAFLPLMRAAHRLQSREDLSPALRRWVQSLAQGLPLIAAFSFMALHRDMTVAEAVKSVAGTFVKVALIVALCSAALDWLIERFPFRRK